MWPMVSGSSVTQYTWNDNLDCELPEDKDCFLLIFVSHCLNICCLNGSLIEDPLSNLSQILLIR